MSGIVSSWINTRVTSLGADLFFPVWECLMFILLGESLIQRTEKKKIYIYTLSSTYLKKFYKPNKRILSLYSDLFKNLKRTYAA